MSQLIDSVIDEKAIKKQLDGLNSDLKTTSANLAGCAVSAKNFSDQFANAKGMNEILLVLDKYNKTVAQSQKAQNDLVTIESKRADVEIKLQKAEILAAAAAEKKAASDTITAKAAENSAQASEKKAQSDAKAAAAAEKVAAANKVLSDAEKSLTSILTKAGLEVDKLNVSKNEAKKIATLTQTANNAEKGSYQQLSAQYNLTWVAYKKLSDTQRDGSAGKAMEKSLNDMSTKMKEVNGGIGNFGMNVGNYKNSILNALSANNSFIGNLAATAMGAKDAGTSLATVGVQGVKSFGTALYSLLANPVVAILAAIAVTIMLVKAAIDSNGEATNKLNEVMAPFKAILSLVMNIFSQLVTIILSGVLAVEKFYMAILSLIPGLDKIAEAGKKAIALEKEKQKLAADMRADTLKDAKEELVIMENRNKSRQKDKYSIQDRLKFLKEADNMELALAKDHQELSTRNFELRKKQMENEGKTYKMLTKDEKDAYVAMEADIYKAQTEYYQKTMRLKSQQSTLILENAADEKAAADEANRKTKEALDKKLAIIAKNKKSENDLNNISYKDTIDILKATTDNEKKSYTERMNAIILTEDLKKSLLKDNAIFEISSQKLTGKQKQVVEKQLAQDLRTVKLESDQSMDALDKKQLETSFKNLTKGLDKQKEAIVSDQAKDLILLSKKYADSQKLGVANKMAEEQYEKEKYSIAQKYREKDFNEVLDTLNAELKLFNITPEKKEEIEKAIADTKSKYAIESTNIVIKSNEDIVASDEKAAEKRKQTEEKLVGLKKKLQEQLFKTVESLAQASFQRELNRIEKLKTANTKASEKTTADIASKLASGLLSQTEADAQTKSIEDQKSAREDALTEKSNAIKRKQDKADRVASLFGIALNTAEAIMKALADLGPVAGPIAAGIIGTTGALEAAAVMAAPLPVYAKGTEDHPGGPALWGDAGKNEMGITPDGRIIKSPSVPTIVNLPKHTKVLPDFDKAIQSMAFNASVEYMNGNTPNIEINAYNDSLMRNIMTEMITQGANQLNKLNKLDNLKKLDRMNEKLDTLGSIDRSLRSMKKSPWVK